MSPNSRYTQSKTFFFKGGRERGGGGGGGREKEGRLAGGREGERVRVGLVL